MPIISSWDEHNGPINDKSLEGVAWGFVLVRCTYGDDARWSSFLSTLKEKNPLSDELIQSQLWTTIEDEETLTNATMSQASLAFQNWVNTTSVHENHGQPATMRGLRKSYFFYVNDESIESVINPIRASEKTGNFLVFVDVRAHLLTCDEKEADYREDYNLEQDFRDILADESDRSWKLVRANEFKWTYLLFLKEWDPWFQDSYDEFPSAPYVYPVWRNILDRMDHNILYLDRMGYDVYKMLKQIYGPEHVRSVCFETDEAQTGLQRICGYAGGYRKEEFTYPWYL